MTMADNVSLASVVGLLRDKLSTDPPPSPQKILGILQKLSQIPISFDILCETGIGKVVNGFRKSEDDIAEFARSLVCSWKALAQESMDERATHHESQQHQSKIRTDALLTQSPLRSKVSAPSPKQVSPSTSKMSPSQSKTQPMPSHVKSQESPSKSKLSPNKSNPKPISEASPSTSRVHSCTPKPHHSPYIKSQNLSKSHTSKSKSLPKVESSSSKPSSQLKKSSHSSAKTEHSAEYRAFKERKPECDSDVDGDYTQIKEKHCTPTSTGSHAKKMKAHHISGDGSAKEQTESKREHVTNKTPKSHSSSDKKPGKEALKPAAKSHDISHGRSHDTKPHTSGVEKSLESNPTLHSGSNQMAHEKHHTSTEHVPKKRPHSSSMVSSKDKALDSPSTKSKSESTLTKNAWPDKSIHNGNNITSSKSSNLTKMDSKTKVTSSSKSESKKDKIKTKTLTNSSDSNKQKLKLSTEKIIESHPSEESLHNEDDGEQNFSNTGMSFADCLLGPMVTKVKKVTKTKSSSNKKTTSVANTDTTNKLPGSSLGKVKVQGRSKVKAEMSKARVDTSDSGRRDVSLNYKDRGKPDDLGSSSEGQSSEIGQSPEAGRRHRKKRSMSEEEEEAIKLAKKSRRESKDVSLSLPEIQPNYKPIHLPEVSSPAKKRVMTAEEENAFLASKQGKTKVFSGRSRVNRLTSVPRLFDTCMEILCANIDALDEVGGVPYDILFTVLERCTPQQLFHLEDCNPHFLDDTDPLWRKHVERDFKRHLPDEMESWRELYIRKHDEREEKLKAITANITKQMAVKDPGRLTKMAFIDRPAKPPRNVMRQQIRHGTASGAFIPEKRSKSTVQPNRASRVVINSSGAEVSGSPQQHRQARATKVVAPMMMKTLRMIKKLRR